MRMAKRRPQSSQAIRSSAFRPIHNKFPIECLASELGQLRASLAQHAAQNTNLEQELEGLSHSSEEKIERLTQLGLFLTGKHDSKLFKHSILQQNLNKQKASSESRILSLEALLSARQHSGKLKFKNEEDAVQDKLRVHSKFVREEIRKLEKEIGSLLADLDLSLKEQTCLDRMRGSLKLQSNTRARVKIDAANNHSTRLITIFNEELEKHLRRDVEIRQELARSVDEMRQLIGLKRERLQQLLRKKDDRSRDQKLHEAGIKFQTLTNLQVQENKSLAEAHKTLKLLRNVNQKLMLAMNERRLKDQAVREGLRQQLARWNANLQQLNQKYKGHLLQPETYPVTPVKPLPIQVSRKLHCRLRGKQPPRRENLQDALSYLRTQMASLGQTSRQFVSCLVSVESTNLQAVCRRLEEHPFSMGQRQMRERVGQFLTEDFEDEEQKEDDKKKALILILKNLLDSVQIA